VLTLSQSRVCGHWPTLLSERLRPSRPQIVSRLLLGIGRVEKGTNVLNKVSIGKAGNQRVISHFAAGTSRFNAI
jgi:hypothetical protein